jgi:RNA polymerase sigma factor (sigma-70 family)
LAVSTTNMLQLPEKKKEDDDKGNDILPIEVLIKKAIEGDQPAFRRIYELYAGKMYSLCHRYSGNTGFADDLFQDGFIKVFNNLQSYKGLGSFEGWVRRIFVNTCLDFLNLKKRVYSSDRIEQNEDIHPLIDGEKEIHLSKEELLKAIQQLPDGYRTVLNLCLVEGYNHKETAEMLGINEGTSKSQLSKARNKLQEIIRKSHGR